MNSYRAGLTSMLAALAVVASACADDGEATPVPAFTRVPETATPSASETPGAVGSVTPSETPPATSTPRRTATPTATATPHVVATASADEPVASTAFIPASELPLAVMTAGDGGEHVLPIEVPGRNEYGIGLSGRLELGERGMLFWYPELTAQSFWMRNTHYDLSVAFVDGDATIVDILLLEAESLETRAPSVAYRYAIEAPAGWFEARGIRIGDQAALDFEVPDFLRE